jgi:hypothetical protein
MIGNILYKLCYDTPLGYNSNGEIHRRKGSETTSMGRQYDRDYNILWTEKMCEIYGDGTHWIEDEEGQKVTRTS